MGTSLSACKSGILTYKFCSSPKILKAGGSSVLVRAKRSGNGGSAASAVLLEDVSTVSALLLEDDPTVSALLLDDFSFPVSSLSESEEVMSSIMGSSIIPERK